jgi:uncharacterized protein YbjQ (UPF0145 family)
LERLLALAEENGANAIIEMGFYTSVMGPIWSVICAYGTAVKVTPL